MQSTVQIHEHSLWVGGKSQTGKKSGERGNGNEREKMRKRGEKMRTEKGPFGRTTERIPHLLEQPK